MWKPIMPFGQELDRRDFLKLAGGVAMAGVAASLGGWSFAVEPKRVKHAQYCRYRGRYPVAKLADSCVNDHCCLARAL